MATLKKTKIGYQDQVSLNAGQKSFRVLKWERSAMLLICINTFAAKRDCSRIQTRL